MQTMGLLLSPCRLPGENNALQQSAFCTNGINWDTHSVT